MLEGLDEIDWASLGHAYGDAGDVPGLIRSLLEDDPEDREEALWDLLNNINHQGTLYEATAFALPFLREILEGYTIADRSNILRFFAELASDLSVPDGDAGEDAHSRATLDALIDGLATHRRLLADPDPEIRVMAAYAIGRLRGHASSSGDALRGRVEVEGDPRARAAAILALGEVVDAGGTAIDRDLLLDLAGAGGPEVVRLAAAVTWCRLSGGRIPDDLGRLIHDLVGPARELYESLPWCDGDVIAQIGAQVGGPDADRLGLALGLLSYRSPEYREEAVRMLGQLSRDRRSIPPRVARPLGDRLLIDPHPGIRSALATTLGQIGRAVALATEPLVAALDDPYAKVRFPVAVALAGARDGRAIPELVGCLDNLENFPAAANALGKLGPLARPAVPTLIGFVEAGPRGGTQFPWNRPILAASTLARIGPAAEAAIPSLIGALDRPEMVPAAVAALRRFGPAARPALDTIERLLGIEAPFTRTDVAMAYWRAGGDVGRVVDVLIGLLGNRSRNGWWIVEALGEVGEAARPAIPMIVEAMGNRTDLGSWWVIESTRALWRIGRRGDLTMPTLMDLLPRLRTLPADQATRIVESLGEHGPLASEAIPLLRIALEEDERYRGSFEDRVGEDERFLDEVGRALARIEGRG